ncbi:MAG: GerMN domain-containing protein, partial [Bacillota bacterium]
FVPRSAFPHSSALQQLIAGPPEGGTLARTLPEGTRLLAVSVERGTCTVDVSPGPSQAQPSGGTEAGGTEALALQSMVLTLTEFLDVQAVRVLVDGKAGATLGGHVILDTPMKRGIVNSVYPGAD